MGEQQSSQSIGLLGLLLAALAGLGLGALAKAADQSSLPGIGDIGTYLGLWVVVIAVTAATAPTRLAAALRSTLLMVAMVLAYYVATYLHFGVIPPLDIAWWGLTAITGVPLLAVLVWPARAGGWLAAVAVALPVGLLIAEALTFRHHPGLHPAPLGFDSVAAVALLWFLPRDRTQRVRAGVLTVPFVVMGGWLLTLGFGFGAGLLMRALV